MGRLDIQPVAARQHAIRRWALQPSNASFLGELTLLWSSFLAWTYLIPNNWGEALNLLAIAAIVLRRIVVTRTPLRERTP